MAQLFKNQSVQLVLETYQDLTGLTVKVRYQKPDSSQTTGYWDASVSGTTVVCDVPENTIDTQGQWYFHSAVLFATDTVYTLGERCTQYVRDAFER